MYTFEEKICILFGQIGVTAKKFYTLLEYFGTPKAIADNITDEFAQKTLGNDWEKVTKALNVGYVEEVIEKMRANGICAVTCFSDAFPLSLENISDPPYALFCKGDVDLLSSRCLAVVGTRKASVYGRRVAKDFVKVLSDYFTIVSGLAYGIDSVAHETTVECEGKTIAVLGGGIIDVYPSSNQALADKIVSSGGLILTEYGLDATPNSYHFPHRNRIVSGFSDGILVCQAPLKSGTMSTIELALEQGKDVFVVPGEVYDLGYQGSNRLIKTMQAACVTSPRDIVDYYRLDNVETTPTVYQPNFDEQKIINSLSEGQKSFDQLIVETKLSLSDLNFLLANLELKSIIARLPGNCYRLYGGIE